MIEVDAWDGEQVDVVIHGSFEAVAAKMQGVAQCAVTSPPYGMGGGVMLSVPSMAKSKDRGGPTLRQEPTYDEYGDTEDDKQYRWWLWGLVKRARVVFWNVGWKFGDFDWGDAPFGHVIWNKPNAIPFNRAGVIYAHEYIFLFGDSQQIKKPVKSVWTERPQYGSKHPAPFPPGIPYRAILAATEPGDLVFDPFGGSGTTAATAKAMGRHWLTCDVSEQYCRWMDERIEATEVA